MNICSFQPKKKKYASRSQIFKLCKCTSTCIVLERISASSGHHCFAGAAIQDLPPYRLICDQSSLLRMIQSQTYAQLADKHSLSLSLSLCHSLFLLRSIPPCDTILGMPTNLWSFRNLCVFRCVTVSVTVSRRFDLICSSVFGSETHLLFTPFIEICHLKFPEIVFLLYILRTIHCDMIM